MCVYLLFGVSLCCQYSNEVYCVLVSPYMLPYTYFVFVVGIPDHRDMDSFASGGPGGHRFSMQDDDEEDDEATAIAMANRQSVIKFNVREDEEEDLEREVSLVSILTHHLLFSRITIRRE